ncbi:unnamed protein product [Heligmosomoides polygyrus]|uniref:Reverse transcriptase n=1 Tax=Heligmosomoides polygyrus TaxID=6339 RepID=A0A183G1F8_HELPZ|nr:unnamed protein product [Heligmosomoides polygyrus]
MLACDKGNGKSLQRNGNEILRWTAGVTRMDRIRNDVIRQKFAVAPISGKMREARLRWYGHVLRGEEDSVRKIGLKFEVSGKAGVHPDLARDRERWRHDTRKADPAMKRDNAKEEEEDCQKSNTNSPFLEGWKAWLAWAGNPN